MSALLGVGPEVNKFEQGSSDGQQMSLAGRPGPCHMRSHDVSVAGWEEDQSRGPGLGGRAVQRSNASWVMLTWDPFPSGQIDTPAKTSLAGGNIAH